MPKANFGNVGDADDFEPLPPGQYPMMVYSGTEGESSGGYPMWSLTFEVVGGEHDGRRGTRDNLTWSPKALPRVKRLLNALRSPERSVDTVEFDTTEELDVAVDEVMGMVVRVTVKEDGFKGRDGDWIKTASVAFAGYDPPTPEDLEVAKGRFVAGVGGGHTQRAEEQPDEDEIPF